MASIDDVFDKLVELQGDFREHKGRTEVRLDELEEHKTFDNYRTYAIGPVLIALHYIGSKIGMKG